MAALQEIATHLCLVDVVIVELAATAEVKVRAV